MSHWVDLFHRKDQAPPGLVMDAEDSQSSRAAGDHGRYFHIYIVEIYYCGMVWVGRDIKDPETLSKDKENRSSVVFTALCKSKDCILSFNGQKSHFFRDIVFVVTDSNKNAN